MNSYYGSVVPAHMPMSGGQTDGFYGSDAKSLDIGGFQQPPQGMCFESDGLGGHYNGTGGPGFHNINQGYDKLGDNRAGRVMNLSAKHFPNYSNNGYYYNHHQNSNNLYSSCNMNANVNANVNVSVNSGSPTSVMGGGGNHFADDRHIHDRLGKPEYMKEENCVPTPPPSNFSPHEQSFNQINNNPSVGHPGHPGLSPTELMHNNMNTSPTGMPPHCNGMMANPYPWMRQLPRKYTLCLYIFIWYSLYFLSLFVELYSRPSYMFEKLFFIALYLCIIYLFVNLASTCCIKLF